MVCQCNVYVIPRSLGRKDLVYKSDFLSSGMETPSWCCCCKTRPLASRPDQISALLCLQGVPTTVYCQNPGCICKLVDFLSSEIMISGDAMKLWYHHTVRLWYHIIVISHVISWSVVHDIIYDIIVCQWNSLWNIWYHTVISDITVSHGVSIPELKMSTNSL